LGPRQFLDGFDEIDLPVVDDMVGPGSPGQVGLRLRRHGGEYSGAAILGHLYEEVTDPAGAGVDEAALTLYERERVLAQEMSGHALQHHGSGQVEPDRIGHQHSLVGREGDVLATCNLTLAA